MIGQFCKNDHGDRNKFLPKRDTLHALDSFNRDAGDFNSALESGIERSPLGAGSGAIFVHGAAPARSPGTCRRL
jgi:hypothetical protein